MMKPAVFVQTLAVFLFFPFISFAQCMMYPVSLQERVTKCETIILGTVVHKECFIDSVTMQVYTLNKIEVTACLKNKQTAPALYLITEGGMYKDRATVVTPSLQLREKTEYLFFLNKTARNKEYRLLSKQQPGALQTITYAGPQGAIEKADDLYVDLLTEPKQNEAGLFSKISGITKQAAYTPKGDVFKARPQQIKIKNASRITAIGSVSPAVTRAGTIDAGDQITISGSGFGATAGTVEFANANNGGATYISSGLASDIISWSDNSITVKVPSNAGTGLVRVNGTMLSPSALSIQYAHSSIINTFSGFASDTRQRYYLRNLNTTGGYTFQFNTTFAANSAAVASFNRALNTWSCETGVHFESSGTTAVATVANDGTNAVYFDAAIAAGTLGICSSNFLASSGGGCNLQNTVWWLADVDIRFRDIPTGATTWEYGPAAPTTSEYDFESVALHELGHGIGLGHVIGSGQVMHYSISNGAISRTLSANDIAASTNKLSYSVSATCFNPSGSGTPMIALATGGCSTLPVTLIDLNAKRTGNYINEISWKTIQELNNAGFILERGENIQSFKQIAFVKGKEYSLTPQSYLFKDETAGPYNWYYRIIQKDINGHSTISPVVFVKGEESNRWKIWSSADGSVVSLYNKTSVNKLVTFLLYNNNGQLIFTNNLQSERKQFNFQHLPRGIYNYQLIDGKQVEYGKLVLGK